MSTTIHRTSIVPLDSSWRNFAYASGPLTGPPTLVNDPVSLRVMQLNLARLTQTAQEMYSGVAFQRSSSSDPMLAPFKAQLEILVTDKLQEGLINRGEAEAILDGFDAHCPNKGEFRTNFTRLLNYLDRHTVATSATAASSISAIIDIKNTDPNVMRSVKELLLKCDNKLNSAIYNRSDIIFVLKKILDQMIIEHQPVSMQDSQRFYRTIYYLSNFLFDEPPSIFLRSDPSDRAAAEGAFNTYVSHFLPLDGKPPKVVEALMNDSKTCQDPSIKIIRLTDHEAAKLKEAFKRECDAAFTPTPVVSTNPADSSIASTVVDRESPPSSPRLSPAVEESENSSSKEESSSPALRRRNVAVSSASSQATIPVLPFGAVAVALAMIICNCFSSRIRQLFG